MRMRKVAARVAAAVVALVAGAASYQHIASVAMVAGEARWVAYSLPFAIDGLIVVGVAALLEDKAERRRPRRSAWLAVVFGVAATLAANVASAEPTWTGRLVAVAAPLSFLISVEVLTRSGRPLSTRDDTSATSTATASAVSAPASAPARASSRPTGSRSSRRSPRPSAAQRVREAVAAAPEATSAEIAARLGLSERTVQRYRPKPATTAPAGAAVDKPTPAVDKSTSTVDNGAPDLFASNGMVPLVGTVSRAPLTREAR